MKHLIENIRARIEHHKDAHVRRIYTKLIRVKHLSLLDAYDTAHNRVYHADRHLVGKQWKMIEYLIVSVFAFMALC